MSGVTIGIDAGSTQGASSARAIGSLRHLITDEERTTFGIWDSDLKRKIGAYMGCEPKDAYVKGPTYSGWGQDLFERYGWEQIHTVLHPIKTEVLSVDTVPTIISKQVFKNHRSENTKFDAKISQQVSNTVATTWSQNYTFSFSHEINYEAKFMGFGAGSKTTFGFQGQWGKNETRSQTTTVGMETSISADVKPGEEVVAELSANSGKMKVRITYEAYLTGETAVNYYPKFEGHHFYGLPISGILGDSNSVNVTQDIEIGFYTEARGSIKNLAGDTLTCERACCM